MKNKFWIALYQIQGEQFIFIIEKIQMTVSKKNKSSKNCWKSTKGLRGIYESSPNRYRQYRTFRCRLNFGIKEVGVKRSKPSSLQIALGHFKWGREQLGMQLPTFLKDIPSVIEPDW